MYNKEIVLKAITGWEKVVVAFCLARNEKGCYNKYITISLKKNPWM